MRKRDSFSSCGSSLDQPSTLSSSTRERSPSPPPSSPGDPVKFFAYGPIVNDLVRKRRNIRTTNLQPAFLDGYRLSFEFGGIANLVRQRGYRVHGVLMTLASLRDLKKMQSCDIRRQVTQRLVFHYPKNGFVVDEDADDEEAKEEIKSSMAYCIEYPEDVEETVSHNDPAIKRLPQEGYLKLIAEGMHQNRICYEFIEDFIYNIPYIPDLAVSDYQKIPSASEVAKISISTYQDMCDKANGDIYFVLGTSVFMLGTHDPNNPLAKWLEEHGHGRDDVTFFVQIVLMNQALSFCSRRCDVTPIHIAWAENQLVQTIQQHGLEAKKVFDFTKDDESEDFQYKLFSVKAKAYTARTSALADGGDYSDNTMATIINHDQAVLTLNDTGTKKRFKLSVFLKRMVHRR
ncbi:MAG: hypothetical protein SGBAC_004093 [Bacillariaceae sp.]